MQHDIGPWPGVPGYHAVTSRPKPAGRARLVTRMAATDCLARVQEIGARQGNRLCAHALECVHPLSRRWPNEIDNSAAERALRAVALGRKNYLFCGSDAGGERAAAMYSLIGTTKLNGLDPQAYLRHVLERIAEHRSQLVDELLPWNVAAELRREPEQLAA